MKHITLMKFVSLTCLLGLAGQLYAYSQYREKSFYRNGVKLQPAMMDGSSAVLVDLVHRQWIFYSRQTGYINIPNLATSWYASGMSASGIVFGEYAVAPYQYRPFTWTATSGFNFDYEWPYPENVTLVFQGGNSLGQFFGGVQIDNPFFVPYGYGLWNADGSFNPGLHIEPTAINDSGYIAGIAGSHGVVQRPDGSVLTLPWSYGSQAPYRATCVSNSGLVAGYGEASSFTELLLWNTSGQLLKRKRLNPGIYISSGSLVNDTGLMAYSQGGATANSDHVHLWSQTEDPVDLNSLVVPGTLTSGEYISDPVDISDSGNLLVFTYGGISGYRQIILEPVPEPGSLAVLALGAVGLLKKRRK